MLKPARANSWIVASCSDPFGMPSLMSDVMCRSLSGSRRTLAEEARPLAGVADVAVAEPRHLQQHRVLVAVDEQLASTLQPVAGRLPLGPQRVARAAEERREAGRRVRSSASSFMKPTISTSPVVSSWMTAGMSPFSFEKSMPLVRTVRDQAPTNEKSPAEPVQRGSWWLLFVSSSFSSRAALTGPPEQDDDGAGGGAARENIGP